MPWPEERASRFSLNGQPVPVLITIELAFMLRPVSYRTAAIVAVVLAAGLGYAFRPICMELSSTDVAAFTPAIETRTDRDFYLRVFQNEAGRWYQCKTWLSRQFFF